MSFQQALSGLNASSQQLNTIGNNVANNSTVGFKMSTAQFADAYASSMSGGGSSAIGIGTQISSVAQQFSQGNLTTSSNPLDIAINGGGMFRMSNGGVITYSRNGQFLLDKEGFLTNNAGLNLTGYAADQATGVIVPGYIVPLQMNNNAIAPVATTLSQVQVNLDSRATPPTAMTSGSTTGTLIPPTTITLGVNDTFTMDVDGSGPRLVTVPAGFYTLASLSTAIQGAVNTALNTVPVTTATAIVSLTGAQFLEVRSGSVGTLGSQGIGSSVTLVGPGGGFAALFGAPAPADIVAGVDNFNIANTTSYTASTAQTVYDSLGNPHTLSLYYCKTSQPTKWQFYTSFDGGTPTPATNLTFSSAGVLAVPAAGTRVQQTFTVNTGAVSPLTFDLSLDGTTQYGISFGTNQLIQDGYTSGKLSGMSISNDGVVQGRYSNGKSRNMGQIVLANFNNPNGLQSLGNNQWAETNAAGSPIPGAPGSGNLGLVQSGSVEESNVDMTAELVAMITAQRSYQANAQTIKTMDQIMQTLVNLR